jgi:Fe-S cluster biosynthesis and repair protein YggX
MSKSLFCLKLKKEGVALSNPPYPGPLGQKIFENISEEAWRMWQTHQTMLINENRLSMISPEARQFLKDEMEKFLFGEGSEIPAGYTPPPKD